MQEFHYNNILFDFDGTIADTKKGIIFTVQNTLRLMELPIPEPSEISKIIGLPLDDCFRIAAKVEESRVKEASRIYRDIFMDVALNSITLFDGVTETLKTLKKKGICMAIASSRNMMSLVPLIKYLGIDQYIFHIYGEDETIRPKPHPDLALKIMSELSMDSNQTLMVGDTTYDLKMGRSAFCDTCGVTFGNHSRELLESVNPNYILDHFSDILNIL